MNDIIFNVSKITLNELAMKIGNYMVENVGIINFNKDFDITSTTADSIGEVLSDFNICSDDVVVIKPENIDNTIISQNQNKIKHKLN